MKNMKRFTIFLVMFALVFTFSGFNQALAKGNPHFERFMDILKFNDTDIPDWAEQYIAKMQVKNIFKGYNDGKFKPNKPVSQVEAVITAIRLMELEDEAKEQNLRTPLPFKDAKQLDGKYLWAKGYVIVALENELFDADLDKLQPEKAASRAWVAKLLVRALGLEDQAERNMTRNLDFTDADDIASDDVGYVYLAAERGIITGYNDGSFKPNKPVTRAEMAALLARTNDEYQEENDVLSVTGEITELSFDSSDDDEIDGNISIETFDGDDYTFAISSDLLVQYHNRFITADQLEEGDYVSLDVEDGVVIEAAYLDQETIENNIRHINEFKLELKYAEENEYNLSYKNRDGEIRAEVEYKNDGDEQKITGEEAAEQVKDFVDGLEITSDMTKEQIKIKILDELQVTEYEELKIKITFSNGKRIYIEVENEMDEEESEEPNKYGLDEFELKVTTEDAEFEWKYEYDDGEVKAEINHESAYRNERIKGDEAKGVLENFFDSIDLNDEMTEEEIMEKIYNRLQFQAKNVIKVELEIKFTNGNEIEVEQEFDEEDIDENNPESNINHLEMNLETDQAIYQWQYHYEDGAITAETVNITADRSSTIRGDEAKEYIEGLELDEDMTNDEILEAIYDQLEISEEEIVDLELEVIFTNGKEVDIEQSFNDEED